MAIITPEKAYVLVHASGFTLEHLEAVKVSEHFTWAEVFTSRTVQDVKAAGIEIFKNALQQSGRMEKVRAYLSKKLGREISIAVISWWRSLAANAASGGANKSQHLLALATDFIVPGYKHAYIQALLIGAKDSIGFCLEITNGDWTHVDGRPARIVFENLGKGIYKTLTLAEMQAFIRKHGRAA